MHIAALDTRLRVAVSSGWPTSTANMRRMHCPCWNFQGLGEISNASEQNRQAWLIGKLTAMVWWTEQNFEFSDIFGLVRNRTAKPRIAMNQCPLCVCRSRFISDSEVRWAS